MRTRTLMYSMAATAALMCTTLVHAAPPTVPSQPPVIGGSGLNSGELNGQGPLLAAVWDTTTGSSLVQWLGLDYTQLSIPDMSVAGTVLNFGTLSGFATTFASAISAGQTNRLQYLVVAADPLGTPGLGTPFGTGLRATGVDNLTVVNDGFGVSQATAQLVAYVDQVINLSFGPPTGCQRANPCSIVDNPASPIYFGKAQLAADLGGSIPATTSFAAAVGTALGFFQLTVPDDDTTASVARYGSASGFAQWLLSSTGQLQYTVPGGGPVVPLPAAVWLLLSGLAGLGVVARRRANA